MSKSIKTCRGCKYRKKCKRIKGWEDIRCDKFIKRIKSPTRLLIESNDRLWSEIIKLKANGKCERCGRDGIDAHHIITRSFSGTRWDLDNGVFLCKGHHKFWAHVDYEGFRAWVSTFKDIAALELKEHNTPDKKMVKIYLEKELRKLQKHLD